MDNYETSEEEQDMYLAQIQDKAEELDLVVGRYGKKPHIQIERPEGMDDETFMDRYLSFTWNFSHSHSDAHEYLEEQHGENYWEVLSSDFTDLFYSDIERETLEKEVADFEKGKIPTVEEEVTDSDEEEIPVSEEFRSAAGLIEYFDAEEDPDKMIQVEIHNKIIDDSNCSMGTVIHPYFRDNHWLLIPSSPVGFLGAGYSIRRKKTNKDEE